MAQDVSPGILRPGFMVEDFFPPFLVSLSAQAWTPQFQYDMGIPLTGGPIVLMGTATASNNSVTGTSQAVSYINSNGNLLVALVHVATASVSVTSITDTAGNTWISGPSVFNPNYQSLIHIWYLFNPLPVTSITATLSGGARHIISVAEFQNVDTTLTPRTNTAYNDLSTGPPAVEVSVPDSGLCISAITYPSSTAPTLLSQQFTSFGTTVVSTVTGTNAWHSLLGQGVSEGARWRTPNVAAGLATIAFYPLTAPVDLGGPFTLSSDSTLSATGTTTKLSAISIAGNSNISSMTVTLLRIATLTISGDSTITASPFVTELPSLTLSQTSSISAAGEVIKLGSATLASNSTLTSSALVTELPALNIAATSTLAATGDVTSVAQIALSGSSTLTDSGIVIEVPILTIGGTSTVTASPFVTELPSLILAGSSTLDPSGLVTELPSLVLAANGNLNLSPLVIELPILSLTGISSITAIPASGLTITIGSDSSIVADPSVISVGTATLNGASDLIASPLVSIFATDTLVAASGLILSPTVIPDNIANLHALSQLIIGAAAVGLPSYHMLNFPYILNIPAYSSRRIPGDEVINSVPVDRSTPNTHLWIVSN